MSARLTLLLVAAIALGACVPAPRPLDPRAVSSHNEPLIDGPCTTWPDCPDGRSR